MHSYLPRTLRTWKPRATALLTPQQLIVLEGIALGASTPDIAEGLGLSRKTVDNHVTALYARLGVNKQAEAVWAYIKLTKATRRARSVNA